MAYAHPSEEAAADFAPRNTARVEGPLTVEVLDVLGRAQDTASEVRHRLYTLRDRLLGSPPGDATAAVGMSKSEASCFKFAHQDRSAQLLVTLADIDQISADLANRL